MQAEEVQRLVEKYAATDPEVKALWEEHVLFKKQIEKFESKPALTPAEDQEMKRIKKEKLEGFFLAEAVCPKWQSENRVGRHGHRRACPAQDPHFGRW